MVETVTRQAEDEGAWTIELRGDEPRDAEREQPGKRGGDGGLPVADVASNPKARRASAGRAEWRLRPGGAQTAGRRLRGRRGRRSAARHRRPFQQA